MFPLHLPYNLQVMLVFFWETFRSAVSIFCCVQLWYILCLGFKKPLEHLSFMALHVVLTFPKCKAHMAFHSQDTEYLLLSIMCLVTLTFDITCALSDTCYIGHLYINFRLVRNFHS